MMGETNGLYHPEQLLLGHSRGNSGPRLCCIIGIRVGDVVDLSPASSPVVLASDAIYFSVTFSSTRKYIVHATQYVPPSLRS